MTRVVSFSDGFTSTTAPTGTSSGQESYTIANNASGGSLFTTTSSINKTVFIDYELLRSSSFGIYVQTGSLILSYDTAWTLSEGNYQGDEIIVSTIANPEHVKFYLNTTTGVLTYDSGNLTGTGYLGTFKIYITRIS